MTNTPPRIVFLVSSDNRPEIMMASASTANGASTQPIKNNNKKKRRVQTRHQHQNDRTDAAETNDTCRRVCVLVAIILFC
jgi:hypothetical protein